MVNGNKVFVGGTQRKKAVEWHKWICDDIIKAGFKKVDKSYGLDLTGWNSLQWYAFVNRAFRIHVNGILLA
jgi:hypothetical protein